MDIVYNAAPTMKHFHRSDAFIRGLMGPIGSGKSVACTIELFRWAIAQDLGIDKVRHSRWAIIRNTYRELTDTTIRTFFDWVPKGLGEWRAQDMEFRMKFEGEDGYKVDAEFLFRALDRPDDIRKLLSLELTGAWINEAREVPKAVLDMLQGRVGRFPRRVKYEKKIYEPTRDCIIMDTNPPDTDHWWYRVFEEEQPDNWELFKQPSGLSGDAENRDNLPQDYYTRLQSGHDQAWIDVYCHGQYGFVKDGKPIYPEYNDAVHCLDSAPDMIPRAQLVVGIDYGLTPAAAIAQIDPRDGQWQFIHEVVTEDMGALKFADLLAADLRSMFPGRTLSIWGDPAGDQRSQVDENTPQAILHAKGIPVVKAPTNDALLRRDSFAKGLTTLTHMGRPKIVISPSCRTLRKGCAGGYKLRRLQVVGDERYVDKPDKNMYSHVCEAAQYATVGEGEAATLIQGDLATRKIAVNRTIKGRRRA